MTIRNLQTEIELEIAQPINKHRTDVLIPRISLSDEVHQNMINSTSENEMQMATEIIEDVNSKPPPRNESLPENFIEMLEKIPLDIPNSSKFAWETYQKLQENDFKISLSTVQRGLMTPTEQRILKELYDKMVKNSTENE
ncbi:uncharacterized protein LOC111618530 isoform X2 [Centruroides sculpturatus]|uniref:uncharacterized protein LOC111618512 isoform X2 n=1 Tax=Centruroides sculpturatus TaxID=218467 RepID=UPI000C6EA216|nr:uncharacterized protein LOC111618512 isoform X2 [Centruroides sculpturatus]XP_023215846.1 uncharacterized protein LOC111618530 isoform X2 [Centruroides sculpturatus]